MGRLQFINHRLRGKLKETAPALLRDIVQLDESFFWRQEQKQTRR